MRRPPRDPPSAPAHAAADLAATRSRASPPRHSPETSEKQWPSLMDGSTFRLEKNAMILSVLCT